VHARAVGILGVSSSFGIRSSQKRTANWSSSNKTDGTPNRTTGNLGASPDEVMEIFVISFS
jgi:hypothetical protein